MKVRAKVRTKIRPYVTDSSTILLLKEDVPERQVSGVRFIAL
jgi:hypothetical protein